MRVRLKHIIVAVITVASTASVLPVATSNASEAVKTTSYVTEETPSPADQWRVAVAEIMQRDGVDETTANRMLANLLVWHDAVTVIMTRDGITFEKAARNLARFLEGAAAQERAAQTNGTLNSWIAAAGWPSELWSWVRCIVNRESGGDPSARSRTHDTGLMQINDVNVGFLRGEGIIMSRYDLFDPVVNLRAGLALFELSGTGPWRSTRSRC